MIVAAADLTRPRLQSGYLRRCRPMTGKCRLIQIARARTAGPQDDDELLRRAPERGTDRLRNPGVIARTIR